MWTRWEYYQPLAQKDENGGERISYHLAGSVLGRVLSDRIHSMSSLPAIKSDELLVEVKDVEDSGIAATWRLCGQQMSLIIRDFERLPHGDARILARKENQDAL